VTVLRRRHVLLVLLALVIATSGAEWLAGSDEPEWVVPSFEELEPLEPSAPLGPPAPREPVQVSLDPTGRPYDELLRLRSTIERRRLTTVHAPSRRVLFMGGENTMWVRAGEYTPVTLAERSGRRYPVDAIWLREPFRKRFHERIVGVVIVERDTAVVRWHKQGPGYGTDAGLGAITTPEWAALPKGDENPITRLYWGDIVDKGRQWVTADVDGHEGVDTVIFFNGFGDGGFPSIAGYDAAGRRAQIVLWTIVAPWRLAFPDGTPPAQVTKRENELAACLAGRRTVDGGARCRLAR
jgi:hypothetical protein